MLQLTRRELLLSGLAAVGVTPLRADQQLLPLRIEFNKTGPHISPLLFGSNELGMLGGQSLSITGDGRAGVTLRRLGGNLMTGYYWVNNYSNSGLDWKHDNSQIWTDFLAIPPEDRHKPGAVIEAMHRNSLQIGAKSVVTLPLAGYVAADGAGPVSEEETAPSPRFVPVNWTSNARAGDPVDPTQADVPQLLRRLVATFGPAESNDGIYGYILDNEPGLWSETHPRINPNKVTIKSLIERSIHAAKAIKLIDPGAKVFGPASWGVSGYQNLQSAPDWDHYKDRGSFLAAYLQAFKEASDAAGIRLLDVLDVHWYPQSTLGNLLNAEHVRFTEAVLAAPRSLSEEGYQEDSWVSEALPVGSADRLSLPILPSLLNLIDRSFPGTKLAIMEYNFGGPKAVFTGLAVADALGRMAASNVSYSGHWGHIDGWIEQAFRLYRNYDGRGGRFAGRSVRTAHNRPDLASVFAARDGESHYAILINKAAFEIRFQLPNEFRVHEVAGFDARNPVCGLMDKPDRPQFTLPAQSARIVKLRHWA